MQRRELERIHPSILLSPHLPVCSNSRDCSVLSRGSRPEVDVQHNLTLTSLLNTAHCSGCMHSSDICRICCSAVFSFANFDQDGKTPLDLGVEKGHKDLPFIFRVSSIKHSVSTTQKMHTGSYPCMLKYHSESCRLFRINLPPMHVNLALLNELVYNAVYTTDELRPPACLENYQV